MKYYLLYINMCKKSAITIVDDYKTYNAVIDEVKCVNKKKNTRLGERIQKMKYAKLFRVDKIIRNYMEVLL